MDISTPITLAEHRADDVRNWLLRRGAGGDNDPANDIATVVCGEVWVAGDGTTSPVCRACRRETDWEVLDVWSTDRIEPNHRCQFCGHEALIGDWTSRVRLLSGR